MSEATGSQGEAASVLFHLPGYRVLDAVDRPGQLRLVTIASTASEAACPSCGVPSARVQQRRRERLADVPVAGPVEVMLVRRRFACAERLCAKRTFVEVTDEVPLRARVSTRLRAVVLEAVVTAGRVVAEVAARQTPLLRLLGRSADDSSLRQDLDRSPTAMAASTSSASSRLFLLARQAEPAVR